MSDKKRKKSGWDRLQDAKRSKLQEEARSSKSLYNFFSSSTASISIELASPSASVSAISSSSTSPTAPVSAPSSAAVSATSTQRAATVFDDILDVAPMYLTNDLRSFFIKTRIPEKSYVYPPREFNESRRQSGVSKRYFNPQWLEKYDWLYYSKKGNGSVCIACRLFNVEGKFGSTENFVERVHTNFKKFNVDAMEHSKSAHHLASTTRLKAFITTENQPQQRIDFRMNSLQQQQVETNRQKIKAILKPLIFCGQYGLPLRGRYDSGFTLDDENQSGVFNGLLQLLASSGESVLQQHLSTAKKNATYISPKSQNALLDCIRLEIEDMILQEVNEQPMGPYYCIMADEVTDISNWEQLGIAIRYLKDNSPIERLLSFEKCTSITGEAIAKLLMDTLIEKGLKICNIRGQNYDGAGNMAGSGKGCAARIQKINVKAPYIHCANHDLNLALCHSSEVKPVYIMMANLTKLGLFFKNSPKRTRALEQCIQLHNEKCDNPSIKKSKLKTFCKTRWVEKHQIFEDVHDLFEIIVDCLHTITSSPGWDNLTITDASGLLNTISSSAFIAAFETVRFLFGYTKPLSQLLQGESMDVLTAYSEVSHIITTLKHLRENTYEERFQTVFAEMKKKADLAGVDFTVPRSCKKQTLRENHPHNSCEEFYRISTFIPYLDNIINELEHRFSKLVQHATLGLQVLPHNIDKLDENAIDEMKIYYDDLPSPTTLVQELDSWKLLWANICEKPHSISDTLKDSNSNSKLFPNVTHIFKSLLLLPVTSATVERANSSLKFLKSCRRNRIENDRLNSLLLLFVHKDLVKRLNIDNVISRFAILQPRRMNLLHVFDD